MLLDPRLRPRIETALRLIDMDERYADAFLLYFLDGETQERIAAKLEVSRATAMRWIRRAERELSAALTPHRHPARLDCPCRSCARALVAYIIQTLIPGSEVKGQWPVGAEPDRNGRRYPLRAMPVSPDDFVAWIDLLHECLRDWRQNDWSRQ